MDLSSHQIAIDEQVNVLSARLPELSWKLNALYSVLNPKLLPRGLFQYQFETTPKSCIDEINADLQALSYHKNERSSHYLAERVSQKINVLVRLCQMHKDKKPTQQTITFGVKAISTRQQWLGALQEDIDKLGAQRQALLSTLSRLQKGRALETILSLQADLGEIERHLTVAKETLARATTI